jgi:hypothetical protein
MTQDEICKALFTAYAPIVNQALISGNAPHINVGAMRVEHIDTSQFADIYNFVVSIKRDDHCNALTALDMTHIATALDAFSMYENSDATTHIDGREFVIGDGDDSLAVQFDIDAGAFRIWIRSFTP